MNNCLCDKGYEPMVHDFGSENLILPTKGKFDIKIENVGEASAFISNVGEIAPGETRCIGIPQLPCAVDMDITYETTDSIKKVRLWSNKLVCFDWECINQ